MASITSAARGKVLMSVVKQMPLQLIVQNQFPYQQTLLIWMRKLVSGFALRAPRNDNTIIYATLAGKIF
jgi:hypothetical protein